MEVAIQLDPEATYTLAALCKATGWCDRTIRRWRKAKRFPRPFLMGRTPCWRGRTILAWMDKEQDEANAFSR